MPEQREGRNPRVRRCCYVLGFWLATFAVPGIPAPGRGEPEVQLTASEPTILTHPEINDSIGNPVYCLAFVHGGASLATGAASGVLVWDVDNGELQRTLDADERGVDSLCVDRRGTLLVSGGATGAIKVWDARTFKLLHTLEPAPGAALDLAISPDGKLLASVSPNGRLDKPDDPFGVILWDLQSGERLRTLLHRGLVEQGERLEQAGRPFHYHTTFDFLQHFGLQSLDELPPLLEEPAMGELQDFALIEDDPSEQAAQYPA